MGPFDMMEQMFDGDKFMIIAQWIIFAVVVLIPITMIAKLVYDSKQYKK